MENDTAAKVGKFFIVAVGIAFTLPLLIALGAIMGALVGWVVGLLFPDAIARGLAAFHLGAMEPYQLGAFVGFISSFFRSNRVEKKEP